MADKRSPTQHMTRLQRHRRVNELLSWQGVSLFRPLGRTKIAEALSELLEQLQIGEALAVAADEKFRLDYLIREIREHIDWFESDDAPSEHYKDNRRIFLSHKGVDKPFVRRFFDALDAIGFNPWLDESDMVAGDELHRGILAGFRQSCAAVFFITPSFQDERYLRTEINYAIDQKTQKDEDFAIVTLVFSDSEGNRGVVPDLLRSYVWKEPDSEVQALVDIVRALPIVMTDVEWRADAR